MCKLLQINKLQFMWDCFIFYSRIFHFLSSGHAYFRGILAGNNNSHLGIFYWQEQLCILNFRTTSEAELVLTKNCWQIVQAY